MEGRLSGFGKLACFTTDIAEAVKGAEIIMVTTIANTQKAVAQSLASLLVDGQVIILNHGRTCCVFVIKHALVKDGCKAHF